MGSTRNALPLEIRPVDEDLNKQMLKDFAGEKTGFVCVGPEGYCLPRKYIQEAQKLLNFQPRPDDTWLITFPRSGTTVAQELIWLIANNLDFETAGKYPQAKRFPLLEASVILDDDMVKELTLENASDPEKAELVDAVSRPRYQMLQEMTTPRFIKTHLPFSLLPDTLLDVGSKVIYIARNPKDVAVSYYHLNRLFRPTGYRGDFARYWNYFERGLVTWSPYWSHVKEGWKMKTHPNVLFLFYEDMNKNMKNTIDQMAEFLLGQKLSAEDRDRLANYLDISSFRQNPAVNWKPMKETGILAQDEEEFIRKGKTGGWVEKFTPELSARADNWINENLQQTDLRFPGAGDSE